MLNPRGTSRTVSNSNQSHRYRVYRIGAIYAVVAWLVGQLLLAFSGHLRLDEATANLIIVALVLGFIPVVILPRMFARYRAKRSRNPSRSD